jgi:hypothetical protein
MRLNRNLRKGYSIISKMPLGLPPRFKPSSDATSVKNSISRSSRSVHQTHPLDVSMSCTSVRESLASPFGTKAASMLTSHLSLSITATLRF